MTENLGDDGEEAHGIRNRVMGSSVFGPPKKIIRISNHTGVVMQSKPPVSPPPDPDPVLEATSETHYTEYPTIQYQETRLKPPPPKSFAKVIKGNNVLLDQVSKVQPIILEENVQLGSVRPIPDFNVSIGKQSIELDVKYRRRDPLRKLEVARVHIGNELQQMRDQITVSVSAFRQQLDGIKL